MKRKAFKVFLVFALLLVTVSASVPNMALAGTNDIKVIVNDKVISMDEKPFIENSTGRTFVPIRFVAEALNATVDYESTTKKITITKGSKVIQIFVGKKDTIVNGKKGTSDTAPVIKNGRTFVPLRFVAENLDCTVDWDSKTRTITITEKGFVSEKNMTKEELIAKYTALSEKSRLISEDNFKFVPLTDYCSPDKVLMPDSVKKIAYLNVTDLPIRRYADAVSDIYNIELDTYNGQQVLSVTMRVPNRVATTSLLYATKNKEIKINRVQIENATETIVQIGYRDYVVKHKYQLPSKLTEKATFDDVEYIVFYSGSNAVLIKNPYRK